MSQLNNQSKQMSGLVLTEALLILFILVMVGLVSFFFVNVFSSSKVTKGSGSTNPLESSATSSNPYAVLSPATVPSKTAECSQALTYQADGNSGPVTCSSGDLNVLEWNALATLEPKVMTLGYSASASQVQATMCSDASDSSSDANTHNSIDIENTTYQISALYYGWNFSPAPSASSC